MSGRFKCALVAVHALAAGLWSQPGRADCFLRSQQHHMSNCRTLGGTYGFTNGQLINNGPSGGDVICPIPQLELDGLPIMPGRSRFVVLDGWANPNSTMVQACVTWLRGGGVGGSCSLTQNFSNQVYHASFAMTTFDPEDFAYLFVFTAGKSGGSVNSLFGYSYTVNSTGSCPPR